MNDLFLSLKYVGVKTPWEILGNATQYGWSCRKWIRNQAELSDKNALKTFADSLINDNLILFDLLPEINRISERVQRWRKDPIHFSLEPSEREPFKDLRRYISLARSDPKTMQGVLVSEFKFRDINDIPLSQFPNAFKALVVARFASTMFGNDVDFSTSFEFAEKLSFKIFGDLLDKYGYEKPNQIQDQPDLVDWFLEECGLEFEIDVPASLADQNFISRESVFIDTVSTDKNIFCNFEYKQGKVHVRANRNHSWSTKFTEFEVVYDTLMLALGDTYLSQLGSREVIEEFFAELGMNLNQRILATA